MRIGKIGFLVVCGLFTAAAFAEGTRDTGPSQSANSVYLVTLSDAPVLNYRGGEKSLSNGRTLLATDPEITGAKRLDITESKIVAYTNFLDNRRQQVLSAAKSALKSELNPTHLYRYTANGFAIALSPDAAKRLALIPGVKLVEPEFTRELLTDAGPAWIGADALWNGQTPNPSAQSRGAGKILGMVDSGINETHPSFAQASADGYTHINPRGRFFGLCVASPARCNSKLIGIYEHTSEGARDGKDTTGHGSHVAGIAVGNHYPTTMTGQTSQLPIVLSGVAPRAGLISYKACTLNDQCPGSSLLAALEQAVIDQVDVLNYSIGGNARDPWSSVRSGGLNDAAVMLNARAAGIVVSVSAGNSGPRERSVGSPSNSPWVISVANASHHRVFRNEATGVRYAGGPAPEVFTGLGFTGALSDRKIVHGSSKGSALCGMGTAIDSPPTGASNPWPANTFNGEIVICDRGIYGRTTKGFNVLAAGGAGMILVNTAETGESTVSDDHFLPALHLGAIAGTALKARLSQALAAGQDLRGAISGTLRVMDSNRGDILSSSSSRGPVTPVSGYLKPNITGPGSSILAADQTGNGIVFKSGTSMAAPHIAGAALLLKSAFPTWNVDQVESALLTTTLPGVKMPDGVTLAGPHNAGSGRAFIPQAANSGLYLAVSRSQFVSADPNSGGDPKQLNLPSLMNERCFENCTFTRTLTSGISSGTWRARLETPLSGVSISPSANFSLGQGQSQTIQVNFDVRNPEFTGSWLEGTVLIENIAGPAAASTLRMPFSVFASAGNVPERIDINASASAGRHELGLSGITALPQAVFLTSELSKLDTTSRNLIKDSNTEVFDSLTDGVFYLAFDGPTSLVGSLLNPKFVASISSNAFGADFDLYVGIDRDGDRAPDENELLCRSISTTNTESCQIDLALPSGSSFETVWVMVRADNAPAGGASVDLSTALISGNSTANSTQVNFSPKRLTASGPGKVASGAAFTTQISWNDPRILPGETWVGVLGLSAISNRIGKVGQVPVFIRHNGTYQSEALVGVGAKQIRLPAGAAQDRIVVDVPANGSQLNATTAGSGEVDLYIAKATDSTLSTIPPAPARSVAVATGISPGANENVTVGGAQLSPGRWYITPVNAGSSVAEFTLNISMQTSGAAPTFRNQVYYNPARSGHGVFLSEGSGQWVVIWYTYNQDGTPTWYLAQANKPADSVAEWNADLYRYTWDGSKQFGVPAGSVSIVRTSANQMRFSWLVDGVYGSELLLPVSGISCPSISGAPSSLSGTWFAPTLPGYGFSVLALADTEVQVAYVYDALGNPRWFYGQNTPFGASTFPLTQYRGFCPTCAHQAIQGQTVGNFTRSYSGTGTGRSAVQGAFASPLAGSWNTDHNVEKLTQVEACQ